MGTGQQDLQKRKTGLRHRLILDAKTHTFRPGMLVRSVFANNDSNMSIRVPLADKLTDGKYVPGSSIEISVRFVGMIVSLGYINGCWDLPEISTRSGVATILVDEKTIYQPVANLVPLKKSEMK